MCAAEIQNRTRDVMMGVAGYPTTTTAIPLSSISLENAGILAGLQSKSGTTGESDPYTTNPISRSLDAK